MNFEISGPIVVIDVQPGYNDWCGPLAGQLMKALSALEGPVVAAFVGEGYPHDTCADVRAYWRKHGATQDLLSRTRFIEKTYGFFRGWMDMGVGDEHIVEVAKYLREQRLWSTQELDDALLGAVLPHLDEHEMGRMLNSPISLPGELEGVRLLDGSKWTTCGGGRDECLKEFELWMQTRDVAYERADHLTY